MSIEREDVDASPIDLGDIATGERSPSAHPGERLREDFLEPMGISVYALAKAIKVPRSRVNDIVRGRRAITADTAMRLARYLGTTAKFWVDLQAGYDLESVKQRHNDRIETEVTPRVA